MNKSCITKIIPTKALGEFSLWKDHVDYPILAIDKLRGVVYFKNEADEINEIEGQNIKNYLEIDISKLYDRMDKLREEHPDYFI